MTDQLISFETAKLAKEKGFDIFTDFMNYYDLNGKFEERLCENLDEDSDGDFCPGFNINNPTLYSNPYYPTAIYYPAPTQSLLQKWLREEHNSNIATMPWNSKTWWWQIEDIGNYDSGFNLKSESDIQYNSYEEALEQGLIEALKLTKL